jgi:uncharacterized protein YhaN
MKILAAEIDGFGVWSGLKLENLAERVTVFYGPNEAGKTTLLQFVRTMLYGFSPERGRRYLPPVRGGRPGGSLEVSGSGGRFTICRHASPSLSAVGELRVLAADGALQPDQLLPGLLGGIDEPTFNHVFAVGLREMQELGTLSDSAAAEFLYHLSTGLNGVAPADVLRELATLRGRIVSPDQADCQLGELLAKREKLQLEIGELRSQVHRQAALAHELADLAAEIERCDAESSEIERTVRAIEAALAVREPWQRRAELLDEIAALPPLASVPAGAIERLDLLNESLQSRRRRIAEILRSRRSLRKAAAAIDFNARFARHAPRIEALAEQETWLTTLESQVEQLTADITAHEAELAEHRRELGLDGKRTTDKPLSTGAVVKRLRPAALGLNKPLARWRAGQEEQTKATQLAERLAAQIAAALAGNEDKQLAPALEQAGKRVSQLRRRVQVDERLSQLARHETELTDQSRLLFDRQLLPAWVLVALGAVFVFGVVLVLANMFLPSSLVGSAGWMLATLGALGAAGAAGGKFLIDRSATGQLEACQKQAAILSSQIQQAKDERESLDAELPRGGGPLLTRLQTAEKELATLEELLGIDAQRQAALAAAEAAQRSVAAAENERREARHRWQQALASAGLPKQLTPKQARQFAGRHQQIRSLEELHERRYDELHQRQREFDTLSGRIRQLLADLEIKPASERASEQLSELRAKLAAHQVVAAEREALHERATRLRKQQTKLAAAVRRGEQRRQQLLQQAAATSELELRERAAEHARRQELAAQRDGLSRDIAAALAGRLTEAELEDWLDSPIGSSRNAAEGAPCRVDSDLEAHWRQRSDQLRAATDRAHALHQQRGRLEQESAALVEDRRLASRLVELEIVESQARERIERWRVLTVTERTLDGVRRTFETERQPEALKNASAYLERLTAGRYVRVWAPLGERALRVDDRDGHSLGVELLSRGTREQLFLSLRLALVAHYAARGIDLPLVLDDVLVNFDARRAKAAAAVLRDFAEAGHQVLVFTCHEHLWKLFRDLKVSTHRLPANDDSEPVTVAYAQPLEEPAPSPAAEAHEAAARWLPDLAADGVMEIADDGQEDDEPLPPAKPKRRRKSAGRKPKPVIQADDDANDDVRSEPPHRVSVVRGNPLQHPFADSAWHEPVDDDEGDDSPPLRPAGETPPFDVDDRSDDEADAELWPDETLFHESDDWNSPADDEFEAA